MKIYLIQKTFALNGQTRWYSKQTYDGHAFLTKHIEYAKTYASRDLAESAIQRHGLDKLKGVEIVEKETV